VAARNCDVCGAAYDAKRPNSRYCGDTCGKRAQRLGLSGKPSARPEGAVVRAHRLELEQMGLLDSAEGTVALALAGILDEQKGAVGAAATADRLLRVMDGLRKRRPAVKTPLDELRERRTRRGA
jgi:hypothetical protein